MPRAGYIQLILKGTAEGVSRAPYLVMSDPEIYAREQVRIFRGPVWNYLCLEAELPEPGSFRTATLRLWWRETKTARSARW